MNSEKIDKICKLFTDFDFDKNTNVSDDLKCFKCHGILINGCLGRCECQLCRVCVDGLIERGCRVCPGNTGFCKESDLSNFIADYRVQRRVAQLVVKCPEEMCSFNCELIEMDDHLRVCPMKSAKCVFYGLGCHQSNMASAKMNEHLQLASYSHMEMLMGVIDNMRNEIGRLKLNDERNKNEIEVLKRDSAIKSEKIESLEEDIKLMKGEQIGHSERIIVTAVANTDGLSGMCQEWTDARDSNEEVLKDADGRYTDMATRINAAEKRMDEYIDGAFVWTIDNVAQRRRNREIVNGEYFYGKIQPYKMALTMRMDGEGSVAGTGLRIRLWIYSDMRDQWLPWSLAADVSITIANRANPNARRIITKSYTITKPTSNSSYQLTTDGDFDFRYDDLYDASLLTGDCFVVQCRIGVVSNPINYRK